MDSRLAVAMVFGLGPNILSAIPVVVPINTPAPLKVQEMRVDGPGGGRGEPRIEARVGIPDDVRDWPRLLANERQDLLLALHSVADEMPHILLRLFDRRPVRRVID